MPTLPLMLGLYWTFVVHAHRSPESFQNHPLPATFPLGFGKNCLVRLLIIFLAVNAVDQASATTDRVGR